MRNTWYATGTASIALSLCGAPSVLAIQPQSGPQSGGTDVQIRGARIARTASVRIGGVALINVVVQSSTIATGRIPAGSHPLGPADVTVTNDCLTAAVGGTLGGGYSFTP